MKTPVILILAISFFVSCESSQSSNDPKEKKDAQQEQNKEEKKTSRKKVKDDDRVSGFFEVQIDGKSYTSSQLQDNYCDMTFLYKGEESFVTIRFKDVETDDALLVTFYGDEEFMLDPTGTIEDFMFSKKADNKVNLQFLPGDGKGAFSSTTMIEGSITVSDFSKGKIEATFKGKGALPRDAVTQTNLIPFEGKIKLDTKNVTEMGKIRTASSMN